MAKLPSFLTPRTILLCQGHIWHRDLSARRLVKPMLYINHALTLGELTWALLGTIRIKLTIWNNGGFMTGCSPHAEQGGNSIECVGLKIDPTICPKTSPAAI